MPYEVKQRPPKKDGSRSWYIRWNTWSADGKRTQRFVPETEYLGVGFSSNWSFEEAQGWARKINADAEKVRREEAKNRINDKIRKEEKETIQYLPAAFVAGFEEELSQKKGNLLTHWRKAKQIIKKLKIDPKEWNRRKDAVYLAFAKEAISPSYCEKLLRVMNDFCDYMANKTDRVYLRIPSPRGDKLSDIQEAYESNRKTDRQAVF